MEGQVRELLGFLSAPQIEIRKAALEAVTGFTPSSQPLRKVILASPTAIDALGRIAREDAAALAHDALKALINLSDQESVQRQCGNPVMLSWIVRTIVSRTALLADLACMLLSNLTKSETVAASLCKLTLPSTSPQTSGDPTRALEQLVQVFLLGDDKTYNPHATYDFLASVVANISLLPAGRLALLRLQPGQPIPSGKDLSDVPLTKLAVFTEHASTIRRGGVASIIKNCCFVKEAHGALLDESSVNMLPKVLLPLCGNEDYDLDDLEKFPTEIQLLSSDKTREPDPYIRLTHVETLLLLCTTLTGREHLRQKNAYRVVKVLHESEQDHEVAEAVVRLVNLLMRDEGPDTRIEAVPEVVGSATVEHEEEDEDLAIEVL